MPKTDRGQSDKSRTGTSNQVEKKEGRFATDEEWDEALEDAREFKKRHDKAFRILAGKDE